MGGIANQMDCALPSPSKKMMPEQKSNMSDLAYKLDKGTHHSLSKFEGLSYSDAARDLSRQLSERMPELGKLLHISSEHPNMAV